MLATKKIIYKEKPFEINDVKRVLYGQLCLEEYKAEMENNVESFMQTWSYVYEEFKNACS